MLLIKRYKNGLKCWQKNYWNLEYIREKNYDEIPPLHWPSEIVQRGSGEKCGIRIGTFQRHYWWYRYPDQIRYRYSDQIRYRYSDQIRYRYPDQIRHRYSDQIRYWYPDQKVYIDILIKRHRYSDQKAYILWSKSIL